MTEASSQYKATKTTPISSAIMTITETCSLRGTTYASCTADIRITGSGKVTSSSTSSILTGTDVPTYYMFVHHSAVSTNRTNSVQVSDASDWRSPNPACDRQCLCGEQCYPDYGAVHVWYCDWVVCVHGSRCTMKI